MVVEPSTKLYVTVRGALGCLRWNFVTKHDSAPSTHFFQHIREFYLSLLWRGNMTETFLSSGKFLWISLEVIVFYGVDISRVGLRLENHVGSCRTPNSELPPPETPISSTTPCPQALSFGTSPTWTRMVLKCIYWVGTPVEFVSHSLYVFLIYMFRLSSPPFWEGTSRR